MLVAHAPGMPGTFSPPPQVSNPDMHHGTCVTHVPWCMSGSLTSGFLWSRWRGKHSRHPRRMSSPQFYVSVKRPMNRSTRWSHMIYFHLFFTAVPMPLGQSFAMAKIDDYSAVTKHHYNDVMMGAMASQITSLTIVYSTVYSGADQRKHQTPPSLAFVKGIHRRPVNSPHKWPVTRKRFSFDDVIMRNRMNMINDRY